MKLLKKLGILIGDTVLISVFVLSVLLFASYMWMYKLIKGKDNYHQKMSKYL